MSLAQLTFVHGDAEALRRTPRIGIVGSREAPPEALLWAHTTASALVALGACVWSGLARGVDAAAHEGALAGGGRTVALLAHGVDSQRLDGVYPPEHLDLARRIVTAGGALVSAWPAGTPPAAWRFVARDRHLVTACDAIVAVYSGPEGGTMHAVREALRLGVPVWLPPSGAGAGLEALRGRVRTLSTPAEALRSGARAPMPLFAHRRG